MKPTLGYWILAAVVALLILGVAVGYATRQRPSHERGARPPISRQTCTGRPSPATRAFDRAGASDAAYRFVYDDVFRQDLERGYDVATAKLRQGMGRKDWLTGTIPVVPEPVSPACTVGAKRTGKEWDAVLRINGTFYLVSVVQRARWLVDYFGPMPHTVVPQGYAA